MSDGHSMSRIVFTDTSVTYPGGLKALKNVDLEIAEGEFVVIVGLSGAGKSTLLRAINGLVPVTGSVTARKHQRASTSDWRMRGPSFPSPKLTSPPVGYVIFVKLQAFGQSSQSVPNK